MEIKIEDDKLDRGKELERLFNLFNHFGKQNGHGITMLLNGQYGSGKTTILNFIEEKATNGKCSFNVIRLNIWEEKLFDNPLFSLFNKISALGEPLSTNIKDKSINKWGARVKETGWQLLQAFTKLDCKTIWMSHGNSSKGINLINEYKAYNNAIKEYKQALKQFCEDKKVVLLIDELDRCLPEYQIKTLEVLHHFFDIPNLIVVIAMDKSQLEYSIKNIFGESLDIIGYLNKFINHEVQLPKGSTKTYINSLLSKFDLDEFYKKDILAILCNLNLSLRDIQQIINEFSLIYNEELTPNERELLQKVFSERSGKTVLHPTIIVLLVALKNYRRDIYDKYFLGRSNKIILKKFEINLFSEGFIFTKFIDDIEHTIFKVPGILSHAMSDYHFLLNLINLICSMININPLSVVDNWESSQNNINDLIGKRAYIKDLFNHMCNHGDTIRDIIIDKINLL